MKFFAVPSGRISRRRSPLNSGGSEEFLGPVGSLWRSMTDLLLLFLPVTYENTFTLLRENTNRRGFHVGDIFTPRSQNSLDNAPVSHVTRFDRVETTTFVTITHRDPTKLKHNLTSVSLVPKYQTSTNVFSVIHLRQSSVVWQQTLKSSFKITRGCRSKSQHRSSTIGPRIFLYLQRF